MANQTKKERSPRPPEDDRVPAREPAWEGVFDIPRGESIGPSGRRQASTALRRNRSVRDGLGESVALFRSVGAGLEMVRFLRPRAGCLGPSSAYDGNGSVGGTLKLVDARESLGAEPWDGLRSVVYFWLPLASAGDSRGA
jgi:hypothetical protein